VIVAWREAGANVRAASLPGEPFWTIQEMTIAPGLIAATTDALRTAGAAGQP
jgi:hypothetical protein